LKVVLLMFVFWFKFGLGLRARVEVLIWAGVVVQMKVELSKSGLSKSELSEMIWYKGRLGFVEWGTRIG